MTHTFCASLANRRRSVLINCQEQVQGNLDKKAISTIIMVRVANFPSISFISLLVFSRLSLLDSTAVNNAIRLGVRITDIWFVPVRGHLLLMLTKILSWKDYFIKLVHICAGAYM